MTDRKTVLVVVHTVVYGRRLLDIFPLLGGDFRVQVLFTAPPHAFRNGVEEFLRGLGGPVLPWHKAVRMRFDLALAAGPRGMQEVRAPVITVPHGANFLKRMVGRAGSQVPGLRRDDLAPGGRLPAAVVLAHRADARELARTFSAAVPRAVVAGDPVRDRMVASLPLRDRYRRALGLAPGERLLALTTTWGPRSFFTRFEALLPWLAAQARSSGIRVAVLIHTNVWAGHGAWQVRAWLSRCREAGVHLVPATADWRPYVLSADWIVGDHGSATLYGTLAGVPILLAATPQEEINPHSPAAALARLAPAFTPSRPLTEQLAYAREEYRLEEYARIAARISSQPGRFSRNMRALMYRHLGLGQPAYPAETRRLPAPAPLDGEDAEEGTEASA
ncbi:hypothetical protein FM076_08885 [Streptomyces albus subsp. chlorinus]|uniref:hypothetical protein n=1 Tax=Streptomyces albus TaxID=1888 RepID=UPI00156E022A|nr:hypothetical protein [Streptomyces albus]NSC21317.1 hypothetical protein [Streptomyces albus subsp. chlorinus]